MPTLRINLSSASKCAKSFPRLVEHRELESIPRQIQASGMALISWWFGSAPFFSLFYNPSTQLDVLCPRIWSEGEILKKPKHSGTEFPPKNWFLLAAMSIALTCYDRSKYETVRRPSLDLTVISRQTRTFSRCHRAWLEKLLHTKYYGLQYGCQTWPVSPSLHKVGWFIHASFSHIAVCALFTRIDWLSHYNNSPCQTVTDEPKSNSTICFHTSLSTHYSSSILRSCAPQLRQNQCLNIKGSFRVPPRLHAHNSTAQGMSRAEPMDVITLRQEKVVVRMEVSTPFYATTFCIKTILRVSDVADMTAIYR